MLIQAIIFISLALVFYTVGVWAEKIQGKLSLWHLIMFYIGLAFDTLGTTTMSLLAGDFSFNLHAVTGLLAIILMLIHAAWGTVVLIKANEESLQKFHKFSIVVWVIWLVPYFIGMFIGMM